MAATITTGTIYNSLKRTLDSIIDDPAPTARTDYRDWVKIRPMMDNWVEFLEMSGPGFMAKKQQHEEMGAGEILEGYIKRFIAVTYGLQLIISREAMDDKKYEEAVRLTKRLKRVAEKTRDMLCTSMLVDGWNTAVPLADGLPLFSAAHLLADGSTFSNTLATPATPSVTAYGTIRSNLRKMPDHAGLTEGYEPIRVLCPVEQEQAWEEILFSKAEPVNGNYVRINVAHRDLAGKTRALVPLKWWDNTTTNWCVQTDAEGGPHLMERKKVQAVSWIDAGHLSIHEGVYCRFDFGVIDPRSMYGSQA